MSATVLYVGERIPELQHLRGVGWEPREVDSLHAAVKYANESDISVGVIRIDSSETSYLDMLEDCLEQTRLTEWIAVVNHQFLQSDELAGFIASNFYDYHTIPVHSGRFEYCVGHASGMARLKKKYAVVNECHTERMERMIGCSPVMQRLTKQIRKVVKSDSPVLIRGESGTGKELVAQEVHDNSVRAAGPFVAVNCGSLPDKLIQSELFGHEKGAFTGAVCQKQGKIEAASGGTIFLDEIGDLPYEAQVNLLRFLQEGTIERVGSTKTIKLDVRVIAATHVDLENAIAEGRFREDLYYRLNVLTLELPPLRERENDIELLANTFLSEYALKNPSRVMGFDRGAISVMRNYFWPGNVRELMNRVQRAVVMAEGKLITVADLGLEKRISERSQLTLDHARMGAEIKVIKDALFQTNNNISEASKLLGVSRVTLYRLLEKHSIMHATHNV